jgi:ribosomal protein L5
LRHHGQKAVVTKAKKSIAAFKVRTDAGRGQGDARGAMYEFLDRLVSAASEGADRACPEGVRRAGNYAPAWSR